MILAAADVTTAVVSSAVVAAIVGAVSSFLAQRYLLVRKAHIDADAMDRQARPAYESMARHRGVGAGSVCARPQCIPAPLPSAVIGSRIRCQ